MAFIVLQSKLNRNVVVLADTANVTFAPGNTSLNVSTEAISGLTIRSIIAGVGVGGGINVVRGTQNVFYTAISGEFDFAGRGYSLTANSTTNVSINFVGANNTIVLDMGKQTNPATANTTY